MNARGVCLPGQNGRSKRKQEDNKASMKRYIKKYIENGIFVLTAALYLLFPASASDDGDEALYQAVAVFAEDVDRTAILAALENQPDVTVLFSYSTLLNGAAVEGTQPALDALTEWPEIDTVAFSREYALEEAAERDNETLILMGGDTLAAQGYNGDGTIVAVIDSGVLWTHAAFQDYGLAKSPKLTWDSVAAFEKAGGTPGQYLSARIPFAYDYYSDDSDVTGGADHGTHVSALAVGYAAHSNGDIIFCGAAPAAQLLAMKVFPDGSPTGARDTDVLRAMEDACTLGADVINLSLGSDNGFASDDSIGGVYNAVFQRLEEKGVTVCCAAGNAASAVSANGLSDPRPAGAYTDYGTISAPASFLGATAIAAAALPVTENDEDDIAGERFMYYTQSESQEGLELPTLTDLWGQELSFVMVGGLGEEADYEGLDVAGKIAVVARGVTLFTEKVRLAAQAGAVACLIYNNQPGDIRPAVEETAIPSAVISQEDGAYLARLAETGRGWIQVRLGRLRAYLEDVPVMPPDPSQAGILDASSWGATTDLRLRPHISAPGGSVLSAGGEGNQQYVPYSGTSMASGSAAGAWAVIRQALRARGVPEGQETARLAEQLLESTARILTTEEGIPLSPRRQGAGLLDMSAALASPAVLTTPLLEPGAQDDGHFTLSIHVQNLTQEPLSYTLAAAVLTDAYETGETGIVRHTLSPLDITSRTELSGPEQLTIPAGMEAAADWSITVSESLRTELDKVYPNGFFVEGYIILTPADGGIPLHASFMGYCGDWEAAPIVEPLDFRDVQNAQAALAEKGENGRSWRDVLPLNLNANRAELAVGEELRLSLGENRHTTAVHTDTYNLAPAQDANGLYSARPGLSVYVYTLRNAARVIELFSNLETGEIYKVRDQDWVSKSVVNILTGTAASQLAVQWDGLDAQGKAVPGGTKIQFSVYAWREGDAGLAALDKLDAAEPASYQELLEGEAYQPALAWRFPFTLDSSAPQVQAERTGDMVQVTVTDDQYLACAVLRDGEGAILAEQVFLNGETTWTATVPTTGGVYLSAEDYAANVTGAVLDEMDDKTNVETNKEISKKINKETDGGNSVFMPCYVAVLEDTAPGAWYHNGVDYVLARGLLPGEDWFTFRPDSGTVRVHMLDALWQIAGCPDADGDMPFEDIQQIDPYWTCARWAYQNGLVSGYDGVTLGPYAVLDRQQLAVILYRLAGEPDVDGAALDGCEDKKAIPAWAADAAAWSVQEGLFPLREMRFAPEAYVTRAEAAQVLFSLTEKGILPDRTEYAVQSETT